MEISPAMATIIAAVVSALIGAAAALIVSIINAKAQYKQFLAEIDKQNALIAYRLEQLEQKVSQHNHFDSRLVALEEQVKTLFNRANG